MLLQLLNLITEVNIFIGYMIYIINSYILSAIVKKLFFVSFKMLNNGGELL